MQAHSKQNTKNNDNNNDNVNNNDDNDNDNDNNDNNDNSPGHWPIGALDILQGCVLNVPRPRQAGAPGPSAAKISATRSS